MWKKRPSDIPLPNNKRWCGWCASIVDNRGFNRHDKSCQSKEPPPNIGILKDTHQSPSGVGYSPLAETIPDEPESEEEDMQVDGDLGSQQVPSCEAFIRIIHHPHSGNYTSSVISLDNPISGNTSQPLILSNCIKPLTMAKPWAPFRNEADFEFSRLAVSKGFDKDTTETIIQGCDGKWASNPRLSYRRFDDHKRSLNAARRFVVQFKEGKVEHTFKGKLYTFTFQYRDPWRWLLDIVTDPTLSESIIWYPVQKWLHHNGRITRIYDELNSGELWWEIQASILDTLPQELGTPHCFLPLHLWLDKCNVAKTVTKHPILLRAGFLPSIIRNASGNGGGVLIGYMPELGDPNQTTEKEDDSMTSVEFAKFKREVYHRVLEVIFYSIRHRSGHGEEVSCGDRINRVLYPGFLIHAVDGEEAYCLCGTRGAKANYPCPRCLVHRTSLTKLTLPITLRTQSNMKDVYLEALKLSRTAAEKLLRDSGLHLVENAFWSIHHSDPYLAYSYDMLHALDSGEWGKHQWVLLTNEILKDKCGQLNSNMQEVPRWPLLKHFKNVTAKDFADGNSYRDILKCIVFCLVDILPAKSPVIGCFRLLAIIREIAALRPVSQEHISYLNMCLANYEKHCTKLSQAYGKNYEYPKHHMLSHIPFDLQMKGSTDNYTTRPGEGFQQEVKQHWDRTNFRNTEHQMTVIDENQEAIARITLAVDNHKKTQKLIMQEQADNDGDKPPQPVKEGIHWKLGSPLCRITAKDWELAESGKHPFRHFEMRLREFLRNFLPQAEQPPQSIMLRPYQCLYLRYRSVENWQEKQDILRCNPNFQNGPRYDCAVINTDPISFGRIYAIFSYETPSKVRHDIALMSYMEKTKWKPKTQWDGQRVFEEKDCGFVSVNFLIRACHMIPAFGGGGRNFYLNDLVDSDAFIRFFLEERLSQTDI